MIAVTAFDSLTSVVGTRYEYARAEALWRELEGCSRLPHRGDGWAPVEFADNRRAKSAVLRAYAVGLDFDDGATTFEQACALFAPFSGYVHTTKSHSPDHHRLRVIVLLDRPVTAAEYELCWEGLRRAADLQLDLHTKDASRFWYVPCAGQHFRSRVLDGFPAVADELIASAKPAPKQPELPPAQSSSGPAEAWLKRALGDLAMAGAGGRNAALNKAAHTVFGRPEHVRTLGAERITRELAHVARGLGLTDLEIAKTIASGRQSGEARPIADSVSTRRIESYGEGPRVEPAKEEPRRIELIGAADIFAPLPPQKWVVKGLQLGPGRPGMLAGYGSSAKTLSAQSLAICVAAGAPVWAKFDAKQARVAHLDYEQGKGATARRYQRLALGHGIEPDTLNGFLELGVFPAVRLTDAYAWEAYSEVAQGRALVVVDSFLASAAGADENDSSVRRYLDMLTRASEETDCTFLVIHHERKPNEEGDDRHATRGSSAIFDACGSSFRLAAVKDEKNLKRLTHTKPPADGAGGALSPCRLELVDVARGDDEHAGIQVIWREHVEVEDEPSKEQVGARELYAKSRAVKQYLYDNGPTKILTMHREMNIGLGVNTLRKLLEALTNSGELIETHDGNRAVWQVPKDWKPDYEQD